MIEIVDKKEVAKRKPYRRSHKVIERMIANKKAKKEKIKKMASRVDTMYDLPESVLEEALPRQEFLEKVDHTGSILDELLDTS